MYTKRFFPRAWCAAALATVLGAFAGSALADPPDRVARVGFLRGEVSFQAAGDDRWVEASLNRPLGTGDKVYTDRDSRVELEIGAAAVRLDERSTFNLLNLDDQIAQMELTEGVLNLRVRRLDNGQSYEIDTPTLAFVIGQPGQYRIDIDPQGTSTMVTVFDGGGDVYGENNASYSVRAGNSYRFNDTALRDYEVLDLPRADDFDRWADARDTRHQRSVSSRYVADDMIGYADLDDNGSWSDEREYGNVWYPASVSVGWAPYRDGHWSWIDPWGWTWVDNASWGFAPFHYGRWVQVRDRWGWCPGPRHVRAIYAPALVAFVGGGGWGASVSIGGGPVGWFPLGPRDVYVPWYRASRGYFNNINVRNTTVINNTYITNVYNNYSSGRPITNANYAYRNNVNAVTAVSRETFVGARAVGDARVQVNAAQLRNAQVASRLAIAPTQASFVAANARTRNVPQTAAVDRRVIARTAPPPQPIATAARVQAIQRNDAQPLARSEQRQIATRPGAAGEAPAANSRSRVQVVGAGAERPQPLPTRPNAAPQRGPAGDARQQPMPGRATVAPRADTRTQPNVAPRGDSRVQPSGDRGGLPSSRFAPHGDRGNAQGDSRNTPAQRQALPQQRETPQVRQQPQREVREMPQREAPQMRQQTQREVREMPQREAPQVRQQPQREVREMPQREAPQMRQQPQREVREMPQREAPQVRQQPQREVREMPQREAPQMRQQPQREVREMPQREAPQMRQAPPPQQQVREAPQVRQPPPQRAQPQERQRDNGDKSDKSDDDRRRR
ncbi:DUF6600 domain-containing protein [Dokdonella sp.]|uniref:DUF6600 domain-containing protein n=1 Tax=Dokdonella sp. TaxID=2291710 RepID=UPI00378319FA